MLVTFCACVAPAAPVQPRRELAAPVTQPARTSAAAPLETPPVAPASDAGVALIAGDVGEMPQTIATATAVLTPCKQLSIHSIKATLTPLPDHVTSFARDGYLAWEAHPGFPLELVTGKAREVLAQHAQKTNEAPWFPSSVFSAPDGRIVWSAPDGVFLRERGTTRNLAGGARSGVIVGDVTYYVKDDTVHAVDARGDRVVLKPGERVDGNVISSYVLRSGGGALGLEATAEDVKVGPWKWSAKVLGWIERGKLVDARILDTPIGAADLYGDTYVYADNNTQTELYAFKRGHAPQRILSASTSVDGLGFLQQIYGANWDGGAVFFETPGGIYRLDGCKLAPVAHELLRADPAAAQLATGTPIGAERPSDRRAPRRPSHPPNDEPVAEPTAEAKTVGTTILHGNYGDALAGNRAIVRRITVDGAPKADGSTRWSSTSYLYEPQ